MKTYVKLWRTLSNQHKRKLFYIIFLMIIVSVAELVTIGAVIPFIDILSNRDGVNSYEIVQEALNLFSMKMDEAIFLTTVLFALAAIISGFLRVGLLWTQVRFSQAVGASFAAKMYINILNQESSFHTDFKSSSVISSIIHKTNIMVSQGVLPLVIMVSSIILIAFLMAGMLVINAEITLFLIIFVLIVYFIIVMMSRLVLDKSGQIINRLSDERVENIQEGLGGVRDILINSSQERYANNYNVIDERLRQSQADVQIIGATPRYLIEALGVALIAISAYIFSDDENSNQILATLAGLALAAQRLLPALQQVFSAWSKLKAGNSSVISTLEIIEKEVEQYCDDSDDSDDSDSDSDEHQDRNVILDNITFLYPKTRGVILKNLSLQVNRGECIAIVGKTGVGKSTLLDILLCLHFSEKGKYRLFGHKVNNKNSRRLRMLISHVPQKVFIKDGTVLENLLFGLNKPEVDYERLLQCLSAAEFDVTKKHSNLTLETEVGENGSRLSGGQRQRLAIARALYKESELLILDEPTSSLDEKTSIKILSNIAKMYPNKTMIIVTHQINQLTFFDSVYELKNKRLTLIER